MDELWTGGSCRNSWEELERRSEIEGRIRWTGGGRAGAAEIAWGEIEGQDPVDGRTGCGRAGGAEIAWEEGG